MEINWSAERSGVTFVQCVHAAAENPELIREFDRLYGTNLSLRGSPIEIMIDEASGKLNSDLQQFCEFVWDCVFIRLS
jgi:hypothetical protein